MSTPPFLLHPFTFLVVQKSIIIVLLAFSPSGSIFRPLLFPILLTCNYYLLPSYTLYITRSAWIGFLSGEVLTGPLDYLEKVLLSRWSFEYNGPSAEATTRNETEKGEGDVVVGKRLTQAHGTASSTPSRTKRDTWKRIKFGTWVAISNRYIASPYQARNTPPYSASYPAYIPSRRAFLRRRGFVFLGCYLITDLLLLANRPALNPILYAQENVSFFPRLLARDIPASQILTRISTTLGFWFGAYIIIQGYYSATAFIAVVSGLSTPADRRPTFGSPGDAYTIRRFWGIFWHQYMRKKFTTTARWLTFNVLRVPRTQDVLARYTQLTLAFLVSGVLHQTIEVAQGMFWRDSGAVQFYTLMVGGIVVEDGVIWAWGKLVDSASGREQKVKSRGNGQQAQAVGWQRALGCVWVILFFSWATPVWVYPQLRRNTGAVSDSPLPFSVVGFVRGGCRELRTTSGLE